MTGRSQYFLRTRMKRPSSVMKSIMAPSELSAHRAGLRARRLALDPVGDRVLVGLPPDRILAERTAPVSLTLDAFVGSASRTGLSRVFNRKPSQAFLLPVPDPLQECPENETGT